MLLSTAATASAGTTVLQGSLFDISGPLGLDLTGKFVQAVSFTNTHPALRVRGLKFLPHSQSPGFQVQGSSQVLQVGTPPAWTSSIDDRNLRTIMTEGLTRGAGPVSVSVSVAVTPGRTYILQALFYGNQLEDRRWDIEVEGTLVADEVTSLGFPEDGQFYYNRAAAMVYRYQFTSGDGQLNIRMGSLGGANDGGNRTPVWQAFTLEEVVTDEDEDGLPDDWEILKFGSLTAAQADGDDDTDGLENFIEYHLGTNPAAYDTDNDLLADGDEYFDYFTDPLLPDTDSDGFIDGSEVESRTNPLNPDSDGDGLLDGAEVWTHHTSPLLTDTDLDGFLDPAEVQAGTPGNNRYAHPLIFSKQSSFSGAEPGEGLDLNGVIRKALYFGSRELAGTWRVQNAVFQRWNTAGAISSATRFEDIWVHPQFPGPVTHADGNLAQALRSIQYDPAMQISVPGLTPGRHYKLQLLFAEECCAGRGFDIHVNSSLAADDFGVMAHQGGLPTATPQRGAVFVHGFLASGPILTIRLDHTTVTDPLLNDPNAILNALTLEEVIPATDTDGDELPDAWEIAFFGNLSRTAGDDPDGDGMTNLVELRDYTNPADPDTDGDGFNDFDEGDWRADPLSADSDNDGLRDGEERTIYDTDPTDPDSDGDRLNDGAEVYTHLTSPEDADTDNDTLPDGLELLDLHTSALSIDSDGDTANDATEYHNGSNPLSPLSGPGPTHVATVLNAGPSGGLDLRGQFRYAVNIGETGPALAVGDASFTSPANTPGFIINSNASVQNWTAPLFGDGLENKNLARIFSSMNWRNDSPPGMDVALQNLLPGQRYRLQLFFTDKPEAKRFFDVSVGGKRLADRLHIARIQGEFFAGAAISHEFTADLSSLLIRLEPPASHGPDEDINPLLNGLTLEQLPPVPDHSITSVEKRPAGMFLHLKGSTARSYALDYSTDLKTWQVLWPQVGLLPGGLGMFFDTDPVRAAGPRGFYRMRDTISSRFP